jgi:outer membrane receptor protein involved in Fe transport
VNAGADSRHNESLILNYNPGRINLRGSYGFRQDERHRFGKDERVQLDASSGLPSRYRDDSRSVARPRSHVGTLGIDYLLDERNSFELTGEYFYRKLTLHDVSTKVTRSSEGVITEDLDRLGVNTESERETGVTAAFQHKFPKEDHELRVEASASDAPEKEDSRYTDLFRVPEPEGEPQRDNTLVKTGEKQMRLAVDYANPLSERSKLEAGYAGELDEQDIDNHAEYFDAVQQRFVSDVGRTNRFRGDQIVHAVYGTFERAFGAISVLAGLRVEDASVKSHLVTTDSTITQNYLSLYPTLHLARKLGEAAEIQLNYSRRVNRPESDELNPFPEYTDPRNVRAGNPDLKPENIHSVEFGYQWRKESLSFSPSVYYRYKYNGFTSVTEALNDSTLLTTDKNLSSDQSAGLEFVVSASVANALTATLSTNTFYDRIDASNIGYSKKKAVVSGSGSLNVNFTPVRASMFQINTYYRSARLTPQGKYRPSMVLNAGFRQDLFEERVSLTLTASDIFKTQRHEISLSIPGIEQHVTNRRDGRIFYCGAAYHFGRPEKKAKEKSLQYDDRMQ